MYKTSRIKPIRICTSIMTISQLLHILNEYLKNDGAWCLYSFSSSQSSVLTWFQNSFSLVLHGLSLSDLDKIFTFYNLTNQIIILNLLATKTLSKNFFSLIYLFNALIKLNVSDLDLSNRMKLSVTEVGHLYSLEYTTKIEVLEEAFLALGLWIFRLFN